VLSIHHYVEYRASDQARVAVADHFPSKATSQTRSSTHLGVKSSQLQLIYDAVILAQGGFAAKG